MTERNTHVRIDLSRRYGLLHGVRLIVRDSDSIQIGTEPPRTVVLRHAPAESLSVLRHLDGGRAAGQVISDHDADPLVWHELLTRLLALDLLVEAGTDAGWTTPRSAGSRLSAECSALVHRHGARAADRILQARDDALVVIRGSAPPAVAIATGLASAGVGHVHHQPERAPRLPDRRAGATRAPEARRLADGRTPDVAGWRSSVSADRPPTTLRDATDVAAHRRQVSATVKVHAPAAHQCPNLVVLAGRAAPDLGVAASLSRDGIAHLAVQTGIVRAVVGPLVLPGRSSCLSCAHRYRSEADPGWPAVTRTLAEHPIDGPAFLNAAAAALAVGQILDHLDGATRPGTIDGTLEWSSGDVAPRRRTWPIHPYCGCHA